MRRDPADDLAHPFGLHLARSVTPPEVTPHKDDRRPGRPVSGPRSQVCADNRNRLAELLDPDQAGQMFGRPGERRVAASIPVLFGLLPLERGQSGEQQQGGSVFRSTPPGDLTAMAHRDHRSEVGGEGRDDERDAPLSALGTLGAVAARLDLRDIHDRATPWPRSVIPLAVWLHNRLDHLCAADWVGDAWHDLRRLHSQLRGAAGDPAPRPLGPCIARVDNDGKLLDGGPWECGVPLYLPPQAPKGGDEEVALPKELRCSACGWTYTRGELVKLANKSVRAAALATKVSA